jgi:protein TonB
MGLGVWLTLGIVHSLHRVVARNMTGTDKLGAIVHSAQMASPRPRIARKKARPKARRLKALEHPLPELDTPLAPMDFALKGYDWLDEGVIAEQVLSEIKEVVMTSDVVDHKPVPLSRAPLSYPQDARQRGIEGFVVLNMLVNGEGMVETAQVLESQPQGIFEEVALLAVKGWRFQPAVYRGNKVRVWSKQTIRFDLN